MTIQELKDLKYEIEQSEKEKIKLEGRLEYLKGVLKDKFKCDSVREAEKKRDGYSKELDRLMNEIQERVEAISGNIEFDRS